MRRQWMAVVTVSALTLGMTGCGSQDTKAVPVQSVAMLAGLTDAMQSQQFAGVVSTGKETSISRDSSRKIAKVNVKKGDIVKEGDVLFTYDADSAKNSLEKAKLELEELKNAETSKKAEIKELQTDKTKAKADAQLDYTLKIQEAETDLRETQYNIGLKEKEIKSYEDQTKDLDVKSTFAGRIEKAGEADTGTSTDVFGTENDGSAYDYSTGEDSDNSGFIKIVEIDNYRIKGSINEQNIGDIYQGESMIIHSRVDSTKTWTGVISEIVTTSTESNASNNDVYDMGVTDASTSSSRYTFYVALDGLDGLMIGQHVYMSADDGYVDDGTIRLSTGYINDITGTSPWIWAESESQKLEKRTVTLGEYDPEADTYVITSGLDELDYIAFPAESFEEGMPVTEKDESSFNDGSSFAEDLMTYSDMGMIEDYGTESYATDSYGTASYGDLVDEGFAFGTDSTALATDAATESIIADDGYDENANTIIPGAVG